MNSTKIPIKSYKDLQVWQRSHKLALEIYRLSKKERKSFADLEIWRQVIAAAFSVPANIAEGYHSHRGKSYRSHLEIARGSAGEAEYWVTVLADLKLISTEKYLLLTKEYGEIIAMLTTLASKIH